MNGFEIEVEQGPSWLIGLYLSPPAWVNPLLQLLAVAVLAIVTWKLYQNNWRIPTDVQREMQVIAGYVVTIMTATLAMVNLAQASYVVDVTVGVLIGSATVYIPQARWLDMQWPDGLESRWQRTAAVWLLLAVIAFAGPELATVNGIGTQLGTTQLFIVVLGSVMAFYNIGLDETSEA